MDPIRTLSFARTLQRANDLDSLAAIAGHALEQSTGFATSWLYVLDADGAHARAVGPGATPFARTVNLREHLLLAAVVRSREPLVVVDARDDPRIPGAVVATFGLRTVVAHATAWQGEPVAVLGVGTGAAEGTRIPSRDVLTGLVAIAEQVALAIVRLRWRDIDPGGAAATAEGRGPATPPPRAAPDGEPSSTEVLIDAPLGLVRRGHEVVPLGRRAEVKRLLFALAAAPQGVAKSTLAVTLFGPPYIAARHDPRLRVDVRRLRLLLLPVGLAVVAEAGRYRLAAPHPIRFRSPTDGEP